MKIKEFIAGPTFHDDAEKTRSAIVLNTALWSVNIIAALLIAGNLIGKLLGGKLPTTLIILNIAILVFSFSLRKAMFTGYVKTASILFVILGIIITTLAIAALGTIMTPTTTGYLLMIIFIGTQFGSKKLWLSILLISFIILGFVLAEQNHWLAKAEITVGITQWVAYSVFMAFTGNLVANLFNYNEKLIQQANIEIEKQKKVEKELRLFKLVAEQSPVSIVITNADVNIDFANSNFYKLTGYTANETLGKNPRILQSGEHEKVFYYNLWETLKRGERWQGEFLNKKKNGELYWERASISPIIDNNAKTTHYVAIKEDITKDKENKQELIQANLRLAAQVQEIKALENELKKKALYDSLTGLYNRHHMNEALTKSFRNAQENKTPISIIAIDLDNLKTLNDVGGHETGDHALRIIGALLHHHTRKNDIACRYGGDEFILILPETHAKDACNRMGQLHQRVQELTLLYRANQILRITFTAGIATYPQHGKTHQEVLKNADLALYRAKEKGRNRVELFSVE